MTDPNQATTTCPNCGTSSPAAVRFCPGCGLALSTTPPPPPGTAAPDYAQPGGYPAGYPGGYPGAYGYGYAPVPAPRSLLPVFIGLAVAGMLVFAVGLAGAIALSGTSGGNPENFGQARASQIPGGAGIVAPAVITPATIPSQGRTLGNASAPVTVDIYVDYQCPVCRNFTETVMPQIINRYVVGGQVKIMSHDFLVIDIVQGGHESVDAANAALCAADQGKFWTFHDWLFANQGAEASGAFAVERLLQIGSRAGLAMDQFQPCVTGGKHKAEVQAESSSAEAHLSGTPTVVVGGQTLPSFDYASVSAAIDRALGTSR
jgi:protein-disulfide isomerase